jgi:hypothetical protein
MSLDHTVQERASDVVRAVMAASRCGDAMQVAFDICGAAMLVAGDDHKTALAWFMRRCAERLDRDVTDAMTLQ